MYQGASAVVKETTKPAWLLAAAPFVWDPPQMSQNHDDEDDDDEYEDDDEEEELEDLQSQKMRVRLLQDDLNGIRHHRRRVSIAAMKSKSFPTTIR